MHAPPLDPLRAARRFGAFAVLCVRAINKIKAGEIAVAEAAALFEQVARTHRLREIRAYDPRLVDMLIARVRAAKQVEAWND